MAPTLRRCAGSLPPGGFAPWAARRRSNAHPPSAVTAAALSPGSTSASTSPAVGSRPRRRACFLPRRGCHRDHHAAHAPMALRAASAARAPGFGSSPKASGAGRPGPAVTRSATADTVAPRSLQRGGGVTQWPQIDAQLASSAGCPPGSWWPPRPRCRARARARPRAARHANHAPAQRPPRRAPAGARYRSVRRPPPASTPASSPPGST